MKRAQCKLQSLVKRIQKGPQLAIHLEEVLRGSLLAFSLKMLGGVLGFIFNVVLARLLGAEGAGIYYLALTVTTIASVIGRFGLDNALLRFVSASAAQQDWIKVAGLYRQGVLLASVTSLFVTTIVIIAAPWISQFIFSEQGLITPLRIMALGIIPLSLFNLHAEMLKGIRRIRAAIFLQSVLPVLFSLVLLFLLVAILEFGLVGGATSYSASAISVLLLAFFSWRQATSTIRRDKGWFSFQLLTATSIPLLWANLMNLALGFTDTIMLGMLLNSDAVGVYNVALKTTMLSSFLLIAVYSVVGPKFASMWEQARLNELDDLAKTTTLLMAIIATAFFIVFVSMPGLILSLFGAEFLAGRATLMVLAGGQFFVLATGPASHLLIMTGREKAYRNLVFLSAALNALLNIALIPLLGILGAGIATATSLATKNVLVGYYALTVIRTASRSHNV